METNTHRVTLTLLTVSILLLTVLNGCADSGTNATAYQGGDPQGTALYKVSGTIISPVTLQPIQGMTCAIQALDGSMSSSTTTDAKVAYSFSGLAARNYKIVTTKDGNITDNSFFTVTQDMTINLTSIKKDDWNTVMGADHPYDATKAYVSAAVDHTGGGTIPVKSPAPQEIPAGTVSWWTCSRASREKVQVTRPAATLTHQERRTGPPPPRPQPE